MIMSQPEAHRQLDTVGQQIEVLRFFEGVARAASVAGNDEWVVVSLGSNLPIPRLCNKMHAQAEKNLFGSDKERQDIAIEVLRSGPSIDQSFVLAYKLVQVGPPNISLLTGAQYFRLSDTQIYSEAARSLARSRNVLKLDDLLTHIQDNVTDEQWDGVVRACIDVYWNELKEAKQADRYTQMLRVSFMALKVMTHE